MDGGEGRTNEKELDLVVIGYIKKVGSTVRFHTLRRLKGSHYFLLKPGRVVMFYG